MIFKSPTGPFPAEAIAGRDRRRVWLAALAGILANCVAAAVAYALWWVEPLPVLRTPVITQLMVAAYFLIPTKPLDGSRLEDRPLLRRASASQSQRPDRAGNRRGLTTPIGSARGAR